MKKKSISKRIAKSIVTIIIVIISILLLINIPIINLKHIASSEDYSNWMSETLDDEDKVVDIAMLGAHDTFTNNINLFSKLDPYESNGIMQGLTGILVKGFIVKQSVTQIGGVETLLKSGVRYLDIRLTYYEDNWVTKHNYLSEDFSTPADLVVQFLESNPGELLILDFQHLDGIDYSNVDDYDLFVDMLDIVGLLDYAYIVNDLSNVTYGDITNNGTEAKVLIISKFKMSEGNILNYNSSIRSNWANSDDFEYILDFINSESKAAEEQDINEKFRVMQAVTTMQMNGTGIIKALTSWSLINRAKKFNDYLLNFEGFAEIITYLPIIMVDYADTNTNDFNDNIMDLIIDFNRN